MPIDRGSIDLAGASEVGVKPDPACSVGHSATIHGIRDCDRTGGLATAEALGCLLQAAAGRIAVFHHAPLDTAFLNRALKTEFGIGWRIPWIDTLDWFRRRQADRDHDDAGTSTRLEAVRESFGLDARSSHNALDDAISCAEVALVLAAHSRARLIDACKLPRGQVIKSLISRRRRRSGSEKIGKRETAAREGAKARSRKSRSKAEKQ